MGQLMDDAIGLGLAATQVGVMHRVLVYRVGSDAPLVARREPGARVVLGRAGGRRGGLPEPSRRRGRRRAAAPRPRPGPGRARRGDPDRGLGARGARAPARDGPSRRGPDPRSHLRRSSARRRSGSCAREPRRSSRARSRRAEPAASSTVRTVYLGTSTFAVDVLGALATSPHRPVARRDPARPAAGPRAKGRAAAGRAGRA